MRAEKFTYTSTDIRLNVQQNPEKLSTTCTNMSEDLSYYKLGSRFDIFSKCNVSLLDPLGTTKAT